MPKLHERELVVRKAKGDFLKTYIDWIEKHDLTYVEIAQIISEELSSILKFALRVERHGDDQYPSGLARKS